MTTLENRQPQLQEAMPVSRETVQLLSEEEVSCREKFLQFGSKTEPNAEIQAFAAKVAEKLGVSSEKAVSREQATTVARTFLEGQRENYGWLGLGDARQKLRELTPLTDEQEQAVIAQATSDDSSPYHMRVVLWEQFYKPEPSQLETARQSLAEVEMLESIEQANVHWRTAREIVAGQLSGVEQPQKIFVGCDDAALLLLSELRCVGIPASHLCCLKKSWVEHLQDIKGDARDKELSREYHGHIFVRMYPAGGDPILVDPMGAGIKIDERWEYYNTDDKAWEGGHGSSPHHLLKESVDGAGTEPSTSKSKKLIRRIVENPRDFEVIA